VCPFKTRTFAEGGNAAEGGGVPMCTLRNFPHLTDHCIEWARDQFELLFVKLGKSLEAYIADPALFESKIRDKAASEPGAAFFDIRSVTSLAKFAARPSVGGAAQLAFDVFHYLFRDRILDLQAAFPADFRIIDDKTKEDKGPFWGEKKRYPTVAVFNPADEAHTDFILAATCLFSVMVGIISPKREGDDTWLQEYRDKSWIVGIAAGLTPPPYLQAPVNSDGIDNAPAMDKEALENIISGLCNDLRNAAAGVKLAQPFETAEFEKDDDLNFHISMITSAANLRCDNYSIKRTDFQSCKVIAGKIIAAIATTTAAVCGLVMLELFKLQLGKDTDSYMNRAIGLSGYMYTSFTAEAPNKMVTTVETVAPGPDEPLPAEAYDDRGAVKEEYKQKVVRRAYPEKHTVWDKIPVSGALTLKEFSAWLESEHGLKLRNWDFIYGHKTATDPETKNKQLQGVSASVYPPKPVLDYSLVPSLDITLQQATMAIMKTPAAKPTQQYLALWREFKAGGFVPPQPPLAEDIITENTTLMEILQRMVVLAEAAEARGEIETKAISDIAGRKFVVIPGSEAPLCQHIESGDDVEYLCAIKITL
jgi:ubiquitin-activating enzyme E1